MTHMSKLSSICLNIQELCYKFLNKSGGKDIVGMRALTKNILSGMNS